MLQHTALSADDTRNSNGRYSPKEHGVLLLTGCKPGNTPPLAQALRMGGFAVMEIALSGTTWEDWLTAAKDGFMELSKRCAWVSVVGIHLGGCMALLLGEQMHPSALIAISVPTTSRRLQTMKDTPDFQPVNSHHCSHIISMARRDLHAVTCPILVVQSRQDKTFDTNSAEMILQGVSSRRKGVLWLKGESNDAFADLAFASVAHLRRAEYISE